MVNTNQNSFKITLCLVIIYLYKSIGQSSVRTEDDSCTYSYEKNVYMFVVWLYYK